MKRRIRAVLCLMALWIAGLDAAAQSVAVFDAPAKERFALVGSSAAEIVTDPGDAEVVGIAAGLLAEDIERVTGRKPEVRSQLRKGQDSVVIIGTLGRSRIVDALVKSGKLDAGKIAGQWESWLIETVADPFEGVEQALVIAGSDRRGTAFGVFTLSESIGVSPWYYWADVPSLKKEQLHLSRAPVMHGPPSVKYRGIFINDEDWGLQPWAAKHLDTDIRDIGPKTYARVFELLLRLKANYIWPAMHDCTQAFNSYPDNRLVADRYAIVMGASHCEPMLRNNVTEWDRQTMGEWNYETNPGGVYTYWETRLKENGRYENVYTVGMRGIHDSGVPGGRTQEDKRDILNRVIADQRRIIAGHVNPDPSLVPQIFCPYKEVLDIYKLGMELPDDVTIVWPDDNHGYIRNLSTPQERKRSGGSGIYYHMSYWGAPEDYLWLSSTSPAKIAYEMQKAYAYGADRLWVFNVGDIKPCEMEMEFALRLAYDVESWPVEKSMAFSWKWAAGIFGEKYAGELGEIYTAYYRLVQRVRPEHQERVRVPMDEQAARMHGFETISQKAEKIYADLDPAYRDAFFQLILYPVRCADLMNQRWTYAQIGEGDRAVAAYEEIRKLTEYYNRGVAGGKWDGMMDAAPRRRPVFSRPDAKQPGHSAENGKPLYRMSPKNARCQGDMNIEGNELIAGAKGLQKEDSAAQALFRFNADRSGEADLYFLARCPDADSDSWFVSFNGDAEVSNDNVTGTDYGWLKIAGVRLRKGRNELVITQREAGTRIREVALMAPGEVPKRNEQIPLRVIPADAYDEARDGADSVWLAVPGLGIEPVAMILQPYETPSLGKGDLARAPAIRYSFESPSGAAEVEARFLPTHRINEGMGLRYAIQVDDGPVEIVDINVSSMSAAWSDNVLQGFSRGRTRHALSGTGKHHVLIRLLDPGMVLSQVRIYELD